MPDDGEHARMSFHNSNPRYRTRSLHFVRWLHPHRMLTSIYASHEFMQPTFPIAPDTILFRLLRKAADSIIDALTIREDTRDRASPQWRQRGHVPH